MKKIFTLMAMLLMAVGSFAQDTWTVAGDELLLGVNWDPTNTNFDMTSVDGETYTFTLTERELPAGTYGYKVVKNHAWGDGNEYPSGYQNNAKLVIADDGIYTVVFTYKVGDAEPSAVATKTGDATVETTYTVVGQKTLLGVEWDKTNSNFDMTSEDGETYTFTLTERELPAGTYEYKVVQNHGTGSWYPSGDNATLTIDEAGIYTVVFTYKVNDPSPSAVATKTGDVTVETTYTVAGNNTTLFGAEWDVNNESTLMTLVEGLYTWSKTNVILSAGNVEFKVVQDHNWDIAYPENNYVLAIAEDESYDVTITFNATSHEVSATATKTSDVTIKHTYTVVGEEALLGVNWNPEDTNFDMTSKDGETYTFTLSDKELAAGTYEYKVAQDHAWTTSYPSEGNNSLVIEAAGTYDIVFTYKVGDEAPSAVATPKTVANTYTVTFVNGAKWENVYAYVWTMDGETAVPVVAWPGTQLEKTDSVTINDVVYGVYTYSFAATAAPENIIFNDGGSNQTADLVFEDGKQYTETVPEVVTNTYSVTFINMPGWETVKAYAYTLEGVTSTDVSGAWPGDDAVADGTYSVAAYEGKYGRYVATFTTKPDYVVFNNGVEGPGNQTTEIPYSDTALFTYDGYTGNTAVLFNDGDDQYQPEAEYVPEGVKATYARKYVANEKQTVVLPFTLTAEQVAGAGKFYTPEAPADGKIKFNEVTEVNAYTPYLFVPSSEYPFQNMTVATIPAYANNVVKAGEAEFQFGNATRTQGDFSGMAVYGFDNDAFVKGGATFTAPAWRGVIVMAETADAPAKYDIVIGEETGIESINSNVAADENAPRYNLAGQRVANNYRGIAIVNGKKVVVK